jgi:hypothetical protein
MTNKKLNLDELFNEEELDKIDNFFPTESDHGTSPTILKKDKKQSKDKKPIQKDYRKILQKYFPKPEFSVERNAKNNEINYTVYSFTPTRQMCVNFELNFHKIDNKFKKFIDSKYTSKCNIQGSDVIKRLSSFAEDNDFYAYTLSDLSNLEINCDYIPNYDEINIPLAPLNILTKGESWYNSLGFYGRHYEEEKTENENFIKQEIIDFVLHLKEKIKMNKNELKELSEEVKRKPYLAFNEHALASKENQSESYIKYEALYRNFILLMEYFKRELLEKAFEKKIETNNVTLQDFFDEIKKTMRTEKDFCQDKYQILFSFLHGISGKTRKNFYVDKQASLFYHYHPERLVKFINKKQTGGKTKNNKLLKKRKTKRRSY